MTALSSRPDLGTPCTICDLPSVSVTSWPDGTYAAACEAHRDDPQQIALFVGDEKP